MQGTIPANVFLSYVGDAAKFVEQFRSVFFNLSGTLICEDWQIDGLPAGRTLKDLVDKIRTATVVIAFICKKYSERIGAEELETALRIRKSGSERPIIVPIMLAASGRSWWKSVKNKELIGTELADIIDQSFFIPGMDRWKDLDGQDVQTIQKLRDDLIDQLMKPSKAAERPKEAEATCAAASNSLVILGHPTGQQSQEIIAAADDVQNRLKQTGAAVARWADGWDGGIDAAAVPPRPILLQPVAAPDVPAYARNQNRTRNHMRNAITDPERRDVLERSQIVVWHPEEPYDSTFCELADRTGEHNPAYFVGDAGTLTDWLVQTTYLGNPGPVGAWEEIDATEIPGGVSKKITERREQLPEDLKTIVEPFFRKDSTPLFCRF
jgi:hypothetical protein